MHWQGKRSCKMPFIACCIVLTGAHNSRLDSDQRAPVTKQKLTWQHSFSFWALLLHHSSGSVRTIFSLVVWTPLPAVFGRRLACRGSYNFSYLKTGSPPCNAMGHYLCLCPRGSSIMPELHAHHGLLSVCVSVQWSLLIRLYCILQFLFFEAEGHFINQHSDIYPN